MLREEDMDVPVLTKAQKAELDHRRQVRGILMGLSAISRVRRDNVGAEILRHAADYVDHGRWTEKVMVMVQELERSNRRQRAVARALA